MLLVAPLYLGGNRPIALLLLESIALAALVLLALRQGEGIWPVSPTLAWALALLVVTPLLQLVPLPFSWWAALPGHAPYAQALQLAGAEEGLRGASVHSRATEFAWLAMLPPIAMFLVACSLGRDESRRLVVVFLTVATFEAALGILQAGASPGSILYLGNAYAGGASTGTYVNKNHFGALIEMALPLMMAFWAAEILPPTNRRGEKLLEHPRTSDVKLARRILVSLVLVLLLTALLFSRSRGAIGCGLAAFAAASFMLMWRAGSLPARIVLVIAAATATLMAAYVGLTPILERFAPEEVALNYQGRMNLATATVRAALDFLPLGSGLGTFADVFPRYQTEQVIGYVEHAHNDYAELFLELGVVGLAIIALLAAAYVARWRQFAGTRLSRRFGYLQVSAGFAIAAMLVHCFFEFNFHIPANALYFAFLAGIFFQPPETVIRDAGRA